MFNHPQSLLTSFTKPFAGIYNLNDLIRITNINYKRKTFSLGFNQDFINRAKALYERHQSNIKSLHSDYLNFKKSDPRITEDLFNNLINTNLLSPSARAF
jgi:hypothetical protein